MAHSINRYSSKYDITDYILLVLPFLSKRVWPRITTATLSTSSVHPGGSGGRITIQPCLHGWSMDLFSVYSKPHKRLFAFYTDNSATHVQTKAFSDTSETVLVANRQTSSCFVCIYIYNIGLSYMLITI